MRRWTNVMLMVVALAGCHPRYAPDEGGGGPGGLSSVRVKILAAIAARDYHHARELLELAAHLTEEERARLAQMISAAERGLVPFLEGALPHIFREQAGHFPVDTAQARELIQTTAVEACFVGIKGNGTRVYQQILDTGAQIWVYVYNGVIRDAGRNDTPRAVERLLR
jgi:hypothetical protein